MVERLAHMESVPELYNLELKSKSKVVNPLIEKATADHRS